MANGNEDDALKSFFHTSWGRAATKFIAVLLFLGFCGSMANLYKDVGTNKETLRAVINYNAEVSELKNKVEILLMQLSVIEDNERTIKVQWGRLREIGTDMTVSESEHEAALSKLNTDAAYLEKQIEDLCSRIFRLEGKHMNPND